MRRVLKPPRIRPGDTIGVCAPASPPRTERDLELGVRYLEHCGFRVKLGRNVLRKRGYLAGTDRERAADINTLFADRQVRAIFTVRGGYGSSRILPLLDYARIGRNPKPLVGYSDITALHFALFARTGLVGISGPMVASEMRRGLEPSLEERFWRLLMSGDVPDPLKASAKAAIAPGRGGRVSGTLLGGNISLAASLVGTGYFPAPARPLYLFEEIDERPYRVNRMLQQMKLAGAFSSAAGVLLGDFTGCAPEKGKPSLSLREVFDDTFAGLPLLSGIPYGHRDDSLPLPIGIRASADTAHGTLSFLESATE
jgi:muramoyltetrapeptide carboxypeptidase